MLANRDGAAMRDANRPVPVDYAGLAESMTALGYAARLELLDILRSPHALAEIKLSPQRTQHGENADRSASKQAVQAHLDKLIDVGLVRVEPIEAEGRTVNRFVVNPQRFYSITEELRRLSLRYAGRGPQGDETGTLSGALSRENVAGPRLVLVHGVYEGKGYPLVGATAQEGKWLIGRLRGLPISLDYDPYVSNEHAHVKAVGDRFVLTDIPDSKNGTLVNWQPLGKGASHTLRAGDVIGVGRSLLSFVPE